MSLPPLLGELVPGYVSDLLLGGSSPHIYLKKKKKKKHVPGTISSHYSLHNNNNRNGICLSGTNGPKGLRLGLTGL